MEEEETRAKPTFFCFNGMIVFCVTPFIHMRLAVCSAVMIVRYNCCFSYGGNLVRIGGQCEQDWVSWFVRSQLGSASHGKDVNGISDNVADVPGVEAWIGKF